MHNGLMNLSRLIVTGWPLTRCYWIKTAYWSLTFVSSLCYTSSTECGSKARSVSLSQFIQLFLLFFAQGTCMVYISTWSMYKNTIGALANMYLCLLVHLMWHLMWYCRNRVHCCYIPCCWPGGSRSRHAGVAMAVPSGGFLTWCPSWLTVSTEYVLNGEPQASTLLEELLPHHLCNSATGWFVHGWGVQSYVKMQCLLHLQLISVRFEAFFA